MAVTRRMKEQRAKNLNTTANRAHTSHTFDALKKSEARRTASQARPTGGQFPSGQGPHLRTVDVKGRNVIFAHHGPLNVAHRTETAMSPALARGHAANVISMAKGQVRAAAHHPSGPASRHFYGNKKVMGGIGAAAGVGAAAYGVHKYRQHRRSQSYNSIGRGQLNSSGVNRPATSWEKF